MLHGVVEPVPLLCVVEHNGGELLPPFSFVQHRGAMVHRGGEPSLSALSRGVGFPSSVCHNIVRRDRVPLPCAPWYKVEDRFSFTLYNDIGRGDLVLHPYASQHMAEGQVPHRSAPQH